MNKHQIIGRKNEQAILEDVLKSKKAEFIALYGRRRIGKTYLIDNFFANYGHQKTIYLSALIDLCYIAEIYPASARISLSLKC